MPHSVIRGTDAADSLAGGDADDAVLGLDGDDTLDGGGGRDLVSGEAGDDWLRGGDGDDRLLGGPGGDRIEGDRTTFDSFPDFEPGTGDDTVLGGDGGDSLTGGKGDDLVSGGDDDDFAAGGSGADTVLGGDGDDRLLGGRSQVVFFDEGDPEDGPDLVRGGAGDDSIGGGRGSDTLSGERGNDTLRGGFDADTLAGGRGDDLFAFGTGETSSFQSTRVSIDTGLGEEADLIRDFRQGEDAIDLSAINSYSLRFIGIGDFAFDFIGGAAFSGERPEVRYDVVGGRTAVQLDGVSVRVVSPPGPGGVPAVIDVPVDGVADAEIVLAGRVHLQESDFLL